jgi:hypothetical protein
MAAWVGLVARQGGSDDRQNDQIHSRRHCCRALANAAIVIFRSVPVHAQQDQDVSNIAHDLHRIYGGTCLRVERLTIAEVAEAYKQSLCVIRNGVKNVRRKTLQRARSLRT